MAATLSDSVVLIPLLRTGGIILLTYYDLECGVRFTIDNYLVWLVGESVNFWILSIIAVILRRHLFRSLTKVRLEVCNLRTVVASVKDPILALKPQRSKGTKPKTHEADGEQPSVVEVTFYNDPFTLLLESLGMPDDLQSSLKKPVFNDGTLSLLDIYASLK